MAGRGALERAVISTTCITCPLREVPNGQLKAALRPGHTADSFAEQLREQQNEVAGRRDLVPVALTQMNHPYKLLPAGWYLDNVDCPPSAGEHEGVVVVNENNRIIPRGDGHGFLDTMIRCLASVAAEKCKPPQQGHPIRS